MHGFWERMEQEGLDIPEAEGGADSTKGSNNTGRIWFQEHHTRRVLGEAEGATRTLTSHKQEGATRILISQRQGGVDAMKKLQSRKDLGQGASFAHGGDSLPTPSQTGWNPVGPVRRKHKLEVREAPQAHTIRRICGRRLRTAD